MQQRWPPQSFQFGLFFFAFYGYAGVFTPYASLFFADRGMTPAQIGILMSLMQVMRIVGPNFWGWVADATHQRVLVLRATALAACLSIAGLFFGRSFAGFFVVMVTINIFTSPQGPLSEALMLAEMRGDLSYYGKLRLWGSVGFIVAIMLSGVALERYGIGYMPALAMGLLGLSWYASMRMHQHGQAAAAAGGSALWPLLRRREILAFFASCFLMVAAHASLYVYYSLYLSDHGYSKELIAFMWTLGVLAEILFFYYQSAIFRRFGVRALMLVSFAIAAGRFALIGWGGQMLWLLLFAQLLHAFSFAAHNSAAIMTLQRWFSGPLQARGQALFISISYGLGGTAGGLAMSAAWDSLGPSSVFYLAAVFSALGFLAAYCCWRWLSTAGQIGAKTAAE